MEQTEKTKTFPLRLPPDLHKQLKRELLELDTPVTLHEFIIEQLRKACDLEPQSGKEEVQNA